MPFHLNRLHFKSKYLLCTASNVSHLPLLNLHCPTFCWTLPGWLCSEYKKLRKIESDLVKQQITKQQKVDLNSEFHHNYSQLLSRTEQPVWKLLKINSNSARSYKHRQLPMKPNLMTNLLNSHLRQVVRLEVSQSVFSSIGIPARKRRSQNRDRSSRSWSRNKGRLLMIVFSDLE